MIKRRLSTNGASLPSPQSVPTDASASRARFVELDGVRAIAVLMVLVGHFTLTYDDLYHDQTLPPFQFHYGLYGVQLFFLVSGFVIFMSIQRVVRPSDFLISRASRLFPAYWIAVTWSIVMAVLFHPLDTTTSWLSRLINYTMLERWAGAGSVDSVYWTLAIEVQFYAFIYVLLVLTKCRMNLGFVLSTVTLWLTASFLTAFLFGDQSRGHGLSQTPLVYKEIFNLVLTEYAPLFCAGMFIYLARYRDRRFWVAAVSTSALAAYVAWAMHEMIPGVAVGCVCIFFMAVCALPSVPLLTWSPLVWIGRRSYSLYLIHNVTGMVVMHALIPHVGRVVAMLVAFIVVLCLAALLHRVGEVWGTRALQHALKGARGRWKRV